MVLFDEKERSDLKPANHLDNTYDYYDRCALKEISEKRKILNQWFNNSPESEKSELKARFKKSFSPAFFELFLHELFRKQGFSLEPHPELPNSTKRPDFLVTRDGFEFYLEAKEVKDKSERELGVDNRISAFYDSLNRTNSPNFFFAIDHFVFKNSLQPKLKDCIRFIESELQKYDPDEITKQYELNGLDNRPIIEYDNKDLSLVISLIPKNKDARGLNDVRPIGIYGTESTWGGPEDAIKRSVAKKAGRYGTLDKPYLICINSTSERGTHEFDTLNSLFGKSQFSFSTDPNNRNERQTRSLDGVFQNEYGPQYTRVSAIFITSINQSNYHVADHWLVKHPFASNDLNMTKFELSYIEVENNKIIKRDGKGINDIISNRDEKY
jgi:hypothetical protein